jgi:hypothetical protein
MPRQQALMQDGKTQECTSKQGQRKGAAQTRVFVRYRASCSVGRESLPVSSNWQPKGEEPSPRSRTQAGQVGSGLRFRQIF